MSSLQKEKRKDISDGDRALHFAERLETAHDVLEAGYEMVSTVSHIESEAVMTATCVVLSAASDVASLHFPDLTMHKAVLS